MRAAAKADAVPGPGKPRLVRREEAPEYLRKPWVHDGYLIGGSWHEAVVKTLFSWTNETMNAWTMLPGVFVATAAYLHATRHMPSEWPPFLLFALSALPHAPFAIRLHCTIGTSERTRDIWRALDIFFIFTCGQVRALALAWYVFSNARAYGLFAAAAATVYAHCLRGMGARGLKRLTQPCFIRDCILTVLCFSLPTALACARELWWEGPGFATRSFALIVAVDLVASTSYIFRWPERWLPGRFDFVGSGHQIMHVAIVVEYALQFRLMVWQAQRALAHTH